MSEGTTLPTDATERGQYPMADGLLYYFPAALAEVSRVSKIGNEQHNPGQPLHWARDKSTDHANKIIRHLVDAGTVDSDGTRHSAKLAWRALALLQEEMEREAGAPVPRNARFEAVAPALDPNRIVEWPDEPGEWERTDKVPSSRYVVTELVDGEGWAVLDRGHEAYVFRSYPAMRDSPLYNNRSVWTVCKQWRKVAA